MHGLAIHESTYQKWELRLIKGRPSIMGCFSKFLTSYLPLVMFGEVLDYPSLAYPNITTSY